MNNLENLPQEQENSIHHCDLTLRAAIAVAFERTGTEPYNLDGMVKDVFSEFPKLTDEQIKKALRNGGLGVYGKTFKLTTQEICIWIRNYYDSDVRFKAPWD